MSRRPAALILGPRQGAVSGVSTHLDQLLASRLAQEYQLLRFDVGSQGRNESGVRRAARILASPFRLAAAILGQRPALVHLNTSLNARAFWRDVVYLCVAKACGTPVLFQIHSGALPQAFLGNGRLPRAALRALLSLPDAIVVLSCTELEAYRRFLPGQWVLALPNGVDSAFYARQKRAPPEASAPLKLAYVGRLVREKGLFETLLGLSLARADGIEATLVIAGSGPAEEEIRRYAATLGLEPQVHFAGAVSGERKAKLLAQSDVLILASYSEGLPYALLEGMAAGAPPIATAVGAIPDVVAQGVHGLLIAARDAGAVRGAIARLASDRALLRRMGEAGRRRVALAYSLDSLGDGFYALYASLSATDRAGAASGT